PGSADGRGAPSAWASKVKNASMVRPFTSHGRRSSYGLHVGPGRWIGSTGGAAARVCEGSASTAPLADSGRGVTILVFAPPRQALLMVLRVAPRADRLPRLAHQPQVVGEVVQRQQCRPQ